MPLFSSHQVQPIHMRHGPVLALPLCHVRNAFRLRPEAAAAAAAATTHTVASATHAAAAAAAAATTARAA